MDSRKRSHNRILIENCSYFSPISRQAPKPQCNCRARQRFKRQTLVTVKTFVHSDKNKLATEMLKIQENKTTKLWTCLVSLLLEFGRMCADVIDLHGLPTKFAVQVAKAKIKLCKDFNPSQQSLTIITGHGLTRGEPSTIKTGLMDFFRTIIGDDCQSENEGRLIVDLNKITTELLEDELNCPEKVYVSFIPSNCSPAGVQNGWDYFWNCEFPNFAEPIILHGNDRDRQNARAALERHNAAMDELPSSSSTGIDSLIEQLEPLGIADPEIEPGLLPDPQSEIPTSNPHKCTRLGPSEPYVEEIDPGEPRIRKRICLLDLRAESAFELLP